MTSDRKFGAVVAAFSVVLLFGLPFASDVAFVVNLTIFLILSILALSMSWVWGVGGIFSFGQSAFFGLGAYAYALTAMNLGGSDLALLLSLVVPALAAALLGYFLFYGRVGGVYLGVITLTTSLILYHLVNSVSGADFRIGSVSLGGYNGIPGVPPLNWPGRPEDPLDFVPFYMLVAACLLLVYWMLRRFMSSGFGRTVIAIRENELRAELLGYDVRAYKLAVFVIGAAVAGLAGALQAAWAGFVGPEVFGIAFAAQIIIWAQVGGIGILAGPVLGCLLVQALTTWLGQKQIADTQIVLGLLFVTSVLILPAGLLPSLKAWLQNKRASGGRP